MKLTGKLFFLFFLSTSPAWAGLKTTNSEYAGRICSNMAVTVKATGQQLKDTVGKQSWAGYKHQLKDYSVAYPGLYCANSLTIINKNPDLYRWVWTSSDNKAKFFFLLHYVDTNSQTEPIRLSPPIDVREPRKFTNNKGTFFDVFPNIPSQGEELPTNIVWQVEPGVPYGIAFCRLPSYANRDVDNEWTLTGTNPQTETLLKNALSSESAYKTSQGLPVNQTREDCGRYRRDTGTQAQRPDNHRDRARCGRHHRLW